MLMAAGVGNRMRPFTSKLPKPYLPVMGVPVMQFAVDALISAGVQEVVVNIHHLPDVAKTELKKIEWGKLRVHISDESQLLLGSAGGLKKAEKFFQGESFVYLNADVLNDSPLISLIKRHHELASENPTLAMTLAIQSQSPAGEKYRKMEISADGRKLTGFSEGLSEKVAFFSGAAILNSSLLRFLKEEPCDFVPMILNRKIIEEGRVGVYQSQSTWMDIGHPKGWREAHCHLIEKLEGSSEISKNWRTRIEKNSVRIKENIWVRRGSLIPNAISEFVYSAIDGTESKVDGILSHTVIYGSPNEKKMGPNVIFWNDLSA